MWSPTSKAREAAARSEELLYQRLAATLRRQIDQGVLGVGDRMPVPLLELSLQ